MNLLIKFDFIGITPSFLYHGKSSHQTIIGGVLSLLVGMAIFAGSCYFVNNLLGRNTYSVVITQEKNSNSFISWAEAEFAVTLLNKVGEEIPNLDRVISITPIWSINSFSRKEDGTLSYATLLYPVPVQKCKIHENFENDTSLWQDEKLINRSTCFTPENPWNSSKLYGEPGFTGITVWITYCLNNTEKSNCYPIETSKTILNNVFLYVRFKDYYFLHSKKGMEAAIPYVFTDTVSVSSTVYKRIWYNFQNVDYINDEGLIFPSKETWSFVSLGNTREAIDMRPLESTYAQSTFLALSLGMHPMRLTYQRNYYKLQNLIADLGGLFKGITFLAYVFIHYFSHKIYFQELINSNFHSMQEEEHITQEGTNSCLNNFISQAGLSNLNNLGNKQCLKEPSIISHIQPSTQLQPTGNIMPVTLMPNKTLLRKPSTFKMTWYQLALPICCVQKRGKSFERMKSFYYFSSIVESQLDVRNYIKVVNVVDKLCYCFGGKEIKKFIEEAINPWTIENLENTTTPAECQRLRNAIKHNIVN